MSTKVRPYTPVFIIGCPRSGTNILRDVLASHPSISTWPCDELNQLWRYKYYHRCSDVLTADDINSSLRKNKEERHVIPGLMLSRIEYLSDNESR